MKLGVSQGSAGAAMGGRRADRSTRPSCVASFGRVTHAPPCTERYCKVNITFAGHLGSMEFGVSAIDPRLVQKILRSTYLLAKRCPGAPKWVPGQERAAGVGGGGPIDVKVFKFKVFSQDRCFVEQIIEDVVEEVSDVNKLFAHGHYFYHLPCAGGHLSLVCVDSQRRLLEEFLAVFFVKVYLDPEVGSLFA